jgi:nucleoside-diphosphate-sugar epimerase
VTTVRVLLTGAAGYVGQAVTEVLRREHEVRLFDIAPVPGEAEMVVGDIADFDTVARAVAGMDAIVNLAIANTYQTPEEPMKASVLGTVNVLEAARRARINRIVHMSSGAVVTGYSRDTFIHVELPFKYTGAYCFSKAMQEHACRDYAMMYGLTIVALRPWSVCDARTMRAKNGQPLTYDAGFFGLLDRYDLGEACNAGLATNLTGFQPFHVMATDEAEQWFDMERTHRVLGWRPRETFASLKSQRP